MDEARRFLRYVFPGLVFIIELPLILLISDSELFFSRPEGLFWKINSEANRNLLFGLPLTTLVISGGLGYLFSIFHHFLYWHGYALLARLGVPWFICDHRDMLKEAVNKEYLLICSQDGQQITAEIKSLAKAWRLTSAFWHERIGTSKHIEGAEPRVMSIADMMHGAGSAFLASTSAIAVWFFVVESSNDKLTFEPQMYIVPAILFIVHFFNYLKMVKHTQGVINTICADVLRDICEAENQPTILIASVYPRMDNYLK